MATIPLRHKKRARIFCTEGSKHLLIDRVFENATLSARSVKNEISLAEGFVPFCGAESALKNISLPLKKTALIGFVDTHCVPTASLRDRLSKIIDN